MNRILTVIMVVFLSACARESLRPDYGYSVDHNAQVQVINPDARYKDCLLYTSPSPRDRG